MLCTNQQPRVFTAYIFKQGPFVPVALKECRQKQILPIPPYLTVLVGKGQ